MDRKRINKFENMKDAAIFIVATLIFLSCVIFVGVSEAPTMMKSVACFFSGGLMFYLLMKNESYEI